MEDQYEGSIKNSTYLALVDYYGGLPFMIILSVLLGLYVAFVVLGQLQLIVMETSPPPPPPDQNQSLGDNNRQVALIFCYYDFIKVLIALFIYLYLTIKGIFVSKSLHFQITRSLIKASFPKFYNRIMTGRLMNRLSKDIYNIDTQLFNFLQVSLVTMAFAVGMLITFLYIRFYLCYLFLGIDTALIFLVFYVFQKTGKEVQRIESVSKSPVLEFYSEIIRGIIYCKNCVQQKVLMNRHI